MIITSCIVGRGHRIRAISPAIRKAGGVKVRRPCFETRSGSGGKGYGIMTPHEVRRHDVLDPTLALDTLFAKVNGQRRGERVLQAMADLVAILDWLEPAFWSIRSWSPG